MIDPNAQPFLFFLCLFGAFSPLVIWILLFPENMKGIGDKDDDK